jgi:hypothetical protein
MNNQSLTQSSPTHGYYSRPREILADLDAVFKSRGLAFTFVALLSACSSLTGCGAQVEPPDVEEEPLKPLGTWIETRPPSLEERLVYVSSDVICGPTGRCEAVVEWGRETVTTEEGLYQWALRDGVLHLCHSPCPLTLTAEETGAPYVWSDLTQSYAWAGWTQVNE